MMDVKMFLTMGSLAAVSSAGIKRVVLIRGFQLKQLKFFTKGLFSVL